MANVMRVSARSRYRLILVILAILLIWYSILRGTRSLDAPPLFTLLLTGYESYDYTPYPWPAPMSDGSTVDTQASLEIYDWDPSLVWENPDAVFREKAYKPTPEPPPPVQDPFPLLSQNPPPSPRLLQAPKINRPPKRHYPEKTPLFVGFTRNWSQLLQCVVSYIAAGWPPEDIYVVENTGVMYANREGRLTLQNPFYLNHTQLKILGVNIIITPTLLTFSQLQNFYLRTALDLEYPYYFWTHQDLLVFSHENRTNIANSEGSLYAYAVRTLRHLTSHSSPYSPSLGSLKTTTSTTGSTSSGSNNNHNNKENKRVWAHHFFAYDHLTLVNRDAVLAVGGWDPHIPFYASDCDAYLRLRWAGYAQTESSGPGVPAPDGTATGDGMGIGLLFDVGSVMEDVGALLRIKGARARLRGDDDYSREGKGNVNQAWGRGYAKGNEYVESWERLVALGERMQRDKYTEGNAKRNTWQVKQKGGQGEPFYRNPEGFEIGVNMLIDLGRSVFAEKWGHRGCDVSRMGVTGDDAWRLERDWDEETEGRGFEGGSW